MKFKFSIIGITAVLIMMFFMETMKNGFNLWMLIGIILIASFLFWIDYKLERPVSKSSLKKNIKENTTHRYKR